MKLIKTTEISAALITGDNRNLSLSLADIENTSILAYDVYNCRQHKSTIFSISMGIVSSDILYALYSLS